MKKAKKIAALVLAALMVIGIIPMDWAPRTTANAAVTTKSIDVTGGLKTGQVYGDEAVVKVEVLEDMNFKESAKTIDGVDYTGYIQGGGNPKPDKGDIPTTGAAFKITAAQDATVTFVMKAAAKAYYIIDSEKNSIATGTEVADGALAFEAKAGKTYYFYLQGSKACVYDITYAYQKAGAAAKKVEVDVKGGLKTSGTYGDPTIANITVLEDMNFKESAKTIDGVDYTGYIQGGGNPKPDKGDIPTTGAAFKIDAVADATVTFIMKAAAKAYYIIDSEKNQIATGTEVADGALAFEAKAGKTYYFYLQGSKACVYGITLKTGGDGGDVDWSSVAAPVLGTPVVEEGTVTVPFTATIGDDGAEEIVVEMYKEGETTPADTQKNKAAGTSGEVKFKPAASGKYTFKGVINRTGETGKASNEVSVDFVLPLAQSTIKTIYNTGDGNIALDYSAVKEAEKYTVEYSADGATWNAVDAGTELTANVSGLSIGTRYSFRVVASRGSDSSTSETVSCTATAEKQQKWGFITYGNGASASKDSVTGSLNEDGQVTIKSESGKIVPASFDGLSFYYTEVPSSMNFTLRAKLSVDYWTFSNAQEGFGMMATDRLGGSGWNNSYMAVASKVEYMWDSEQNKVVQANGDKVTQKLGIGVQEKRGLTPENVALIEGNDTATIQANFSSTMYPLEQRYNYASNVIGNATNAVDSNCPTIENPITEFYLTIQKNNTGYFVTYESVDGSYSTTKKYYETDILSQLDKDNVYVGFFASRHAQVTYSDVTFTTIDPKDDAPAEERPIEYLPLSANLVAPTATGNSMVTIKFSANSNGTVTLKKEDGTVLASDIAVEANKSVELATVDLTKGKNKFTAVFVPEDGYKPNGEYSAMESYETVEKNLTITYRTYGSEGVALYVAPDAAGSGSIDDPMSIYDAVKYAQPGQQIIIKEGTYLLESTIKVDRGIDGTADKPIVMMADPQAKTRPVFDFQGLCAGMVLAGNHWYFKGFDVIHSMNAQKGIQVSGNNNVLDQINTYNNGSTGLQISRYLTTDEYDMWPANNLILNCTSYNNADPGYEDADGFAAKLTCAGGNVFDGCIAHHNADDGWDLFAKVQSGSIGSVTIKNSIAYKNGYVVKNRMDSADVENTVFDLDINGGYEINAGNGNGFKMGGDSMTGYHVLMNSVAYENKAKGIDSNSCPDIQVSNSISYNNGAPNVALYTNSAANTDYSLTNVISYRKGTDVGENIKMKGTQDTSKVDNDTNYLWKASAAPKAADSSSVVKDDWFVSLDTSIVPTRNADGTINMNGLLVLTDKAPAGVGANMANGTPSNDKALNNALDTYKVIEGGKQSFIYGKDGTLTFRIDADVSLFDYIEIDDVVLDKSKYTVTSGSTVITISASYVKSIKEGEHTIRFYFTDGKFAETKFTVSPKTGDTMNTLFYMILALIAVAAAGSCALAGFKKRTQN